MRHSKHLYRAAFLLIIGLFSFLVVRGLMIPKSFGEGIGFFREDNIEEQKTKTIKHQSNGACGTCHPDKLEMLDNGKHLMLKCELCHDPMPGHVDKGVKIAEMVRNKTAEECLRCHAKMVARPENFPQIDLNEHMKTNDMVYSRQVCFECHNPHSPFEDL